MTEKTKALRLADALMTLFPSREDGEQAAAELRRLHAEVERLSWDSIHTCHSKCHRPLCKLTRERNALLEALKQIEPILARMYGQQAAELPPMQIVRAAIKAVEEEA